MTAEPKHRAALRIADDHVTLPPRARLMIAIYREYAAPDIEAVVERDQSLLLNRGVSVARGIVRFRQRIFHVFGTNSPEQYQHLNKGAAIAFLEETPQASYVIAVGDFERVPEDTFKLPHPFDVNPAMPQEERNKLVALLHRYMQ